MNLLMSALNVLPSLLVVGHQSRMLDFEGSFLVDFLYDVFVLGFEILHDCFFVLHGDLLFELCLLFSDFSSCAMRS